MSQAGAGAPFEFAIRVYYEDTDAGGVVFYANYLKFFERARTEWLRALGVSQERLKEEDGLVFVVRHTAVDYVLPARLDDRLIIRSKLARLGRVAVEFDQEAYRAGAGAHAHDELVSRGRIKVGCVDRLKLRPAEIPESIRNAFQTNNINDLHT
ncbi:MAG: tol-pal system-associated acyl-CoA thioesterase [Burkholderiaceae bacterium]